MANLSSGKASENKYLGNALNPGVDDCDHRRVTYRQAFHSLCHGPSVEGPVVGRRSTLGITQGSGCRYWRNDNWLQLPFLGSHRLRSNARLFGLPGFPPKLGQLAQKCISVNTGFELETDGLSHEWKCYLWPAGKMSCVANSGYLLRMKSRSILRVSKLTASGFEVGLDLLTRLSKVSPLIVRIGLSN